MLAIEIIPRAPSPALESLVAQAAQYFEAARATSTRKSYASDFRDFESFCTAYGLPFLPSTPETVALYLTHLASRAAVSTCRRRLAAITYVHRQKGYDSPATPRKHFVLREVLAGITRTIGVTQYGAEPILRDTIRQIVDACPENLLGTRDRALVLLGFATGSRRSELASILEIGDLTFTEQGLYMRMRRSKTDQEKVGRTIAVPFGENPKTDPVKTLRAWLYEAGITDGPVLRAVSRHGKVSPHALSTRAVSVILKTAAERAGLDSARVSPHGLRAGMVTQAAINGAEEHDIAKVSGHRSTAVLRRYVRDANLFRNSASTRLGL
jgi:site-specific recombinase XerD